MCFHSLFSYKITKNHKNGGHLRFENITVVILIIQAMNVLVATFKMRFYPLYVKSYEKFTFQCRPFWITNCCPHEQIWVLVVLKSTYQNYPVNQ